MLSFGKIATALLTFAVVAVLAIAVDAGDAVAAATMDHTILIATTVMAVGIRAERVIRLHELPAFLGVKRSQINEAIRAGLLHPFTVIPGGRSKCVTEAEVVALQQRAIAEAAAQAAAPKPAPVEAAPATALTRKRKREVEARAL